MKGVYSCDGPFTRICLSLVMQLKLHAETLITSIAAEIGLFDGYIVVYKFISDLHFYVTGGEDENELILATVLQGFFDAVSLLLRSFHFQCNSHCFVM